MFGEDDKWRIEVNRLSTCTKNDTQTDGLNVSLRPVPLPFLDGDNKQLVTVNRYARDLHRKLTVMTISTFSTLIFRLRQINNSVDD